MHYIIGTDILIPEMQQASQGMGPQPVNAHTVHRRTRNNTPFQTGVNYTLHNIRPIPGGNLEYNFVSDDGGHQVPIQFESTQSADEFISSVRDEALPDYNQFYQGRGG